MQNFREKYAYKISLYLLLALPLCPLFGYFFSISKLNIFYGGNFLSPTFFSIIFIVLTVLISIILRILDQAETENWKDIYLIFSGLFITFLYILASVFLNLDRLDRLDSFFSIVDLLLFIGGYFFTLTYLVQEKKDFFEKYFPDFRLRFREKYAYKISLYSLILFDIIIFPTLFFSSSFFLPLLLICFLFSIFVLRFISSDIFKHWKDLNILFVAILISTLFTIGFTIFSPPIHMGMGVVAPLDDEGYSIINSSAVLRYVYYGKPYYSWNFVSMFDTNSSYYIGIDILFCTSVLIVISVMLSIKYLVELRKRDYRE
jgi:hypothetical protein